jgi:protein-S-isoprenylcysteine O-methyltransferase Ste14
MATALNADEKKLRAGLVKRVRQIAFMILIQGGVLFLAAGRLDWGIAWLYLGINILIILVNAYFMRHTPETIAERAEGGENWKTWDKIVGGFFGLMYFIGILLVAGLDQRFGWTGSLPAWVPWGGGIMFFGGGALFSWAMVTNAYFSTVVRIQEERGHAVCREGPYRVVRHPGYIGAILQSFGGPLLFGSYWALVPGALAALAMVVRTALEDWTLQGELDGYKEYAGQVRQRLLPGIW